jgi:hypothetical protein
MLVPSQRIVCANRCSFFVTQRLHRRSNNTKHMKKTIQIAVAGITAMVIGKLTGCSTAGPFVTSISSDGKGDLVVEKNMVHVNGFTGMISMGENPTTQVIKVLPAPQPEQK